ncbi:MAG: hypothetical protein HKL98_00165 [Burkholderiales bacterium]|nr:hypothetical protein [Burkholderiales bacterium]
MYKLTLLSLSLLAFQAQAKTPEWFIQKHPEVKIMERMQAQEKAMHHACSETHAMHVISRNTRKG